MRKDQAEAIERWWTLAQDANAAFQDHTVEDIGGALAVLTAMMVVTHHPDRRQEILNRYAALVIELLPVAEQGLRELVQLRNDNEGKLQ